VCCQLNIKERKKGGGGGGGGGAVDVQDGVEEDKENN